ncbi:MAG: HAMP domain-containing protein [Firmicutes bacterium]|nr:HAMP domain-containing protein [Bacillota bacterium]
MKFLLKILKGIGFFFLSKLSKLRVFYQILLIIIIMMGFIFLEGYLGLGVISQMQQVSNRVFNNSVDGLKTITEAREELNKYRKEYLTQLAGVDQKKVVSTSMLFNQLLGLLPLLSRVDSEQSSVIYNEVQLLKEFFETPASLQKYDEFEQKIALINIALKRIEETILNSATESMQFGNTFSAESTNTTILLLLVSLVFSILLSLIITASISNPLKAVVNAARSLATGDLSENLRAHGCQEVTEVVKGLNEAIAGLRRLVGGINEQARLLINASKELQDASTDSGRSAAEVARAMEELARASSEQANQINQTVNIVTELGDLVRQVSTDTENIATVSEKVADSARLGQKVTGDVANEINELYLSTKEVAEVIEELNRTSGEISEITSVIGGIAEQTTLLALNASIEAARAGLQGKGFSVVAKETGKLAEQSKQAAQMIAELIVQMKTKTGHAVEIIQKGISRVEAGKNLTSEAAVTFESIFKQLRDMLNRIEQVAHSARQMAEKNENVITAITGIATISEQSMASTQEVSATAEEQSAAAQQVSSLAGNLASIADKLKESVAVFEIKDAG